MQNLKKREDKIKLKRSKTSFRDFVKDIGSFLPVVLYRGENEVSRYPKTDRLNVINTLEYEEMRDELINKGISYDFKLNFRDNYKKLIDITGGAATMRDPKAENSQYSEGVWFSKNVYLSYIIISDCENIAYTFYAQDNVKDTLNSVMVRDDSEIIYFSTAIIKSFKVFYSKYIFSSNNVWFSTNLIGCSECILCDDLMNKKYCINNKEYSKEEYLTKKKSILSNKDNFMGYYRSLRKDSINVNSENTKGQFCVYSENVKDGYFCYRLQNARNAFFVGHKNGRKNVLDTMCSDEASPGDIYGCSNLGISENVYMSDAFIGTNLYYCFDVLKCNYCIGCRGLRNRSYCVFNKQYTKEEWYNLANKIFAQMDNDGVLGDKFLPQLSPLYFNDTLAYLIDDSFTKEEVEAEGYLRRDNEIKVDIPEGAELIKSTELDRYQGFSTQGNREINSKILKKVIVDEKGNYYRIVKMEYDFLIKHGLPLPEIHWLDRIKLGFKFK